MADLGDYYRAVADYARAIPQEHGLRPYTVAIRLESFDRPLADDAVALPTTDLVLAPRPHVVAMSAQQASFYGAGPLTAANGGMGLLAFTVGPITPQHAAGGYTIAQLLPAGSVLGRSVIWMTGPDLGAGQLFKVAAERTTGLHTLLDVVQVATL